MQWLILQFPQLLPVISSVFKWLDTRGKSEQFLMSDDSVFMSTLFTLWYTQQNIITNQYIGNLFIWQALKEQLNKIPTELAPPTNRHHQTIA